MAGKNIRECENLVAPPHPQVAMLLIEEHCPGERAVTTVTDAPTRGVRTILGAAIVSAGVGDRSDDATIELDRAADVVLNAIDRDRDGLDHVVVDAGVILVQEVEREDRDKHEDDDGNHVLAQLVAGVVNGVDGKHDSSKGILGVGDALNLDRLALLSAVFKRTLIPIHHTICLYSVKVHFQEFPQLKTSTL